ncbi:calcium-binding protein [Marinibacterium sp. SX1]|uniref:calcium-binding protein n=1 Tax=Marinibacterium sp. SX1 TaxID=3388424 RepID=UPI003D174B2C
MDSYSLAILGNALLSVMALGLILDPFGFWDGDDDEDDSDTVEVDDDQTVTLTEGNDLFTGGSGADTVFAAEGDDQVSGLAGDDVLYGGDGNDTLDGGEGSDTLEGNLGDDILTGGAGDDVLLGGSGTDTLDGGAGNDILSSDRLDGEADFARGDVEILSGGEGDDIIVMSSGDMASGGEGTDQFGLVVVGDEDPAVIEDFDTETETLALYYDPADFDDAEPEMTAAYDEDLDETQLSLNGEQVLALQGVQGIDLETVELLTEDALAG